VVGNLIAAMVLGNMNESNYFYIMTAISLSSILLFATLREPHKLIETGKGDFSVITTTGALQDKPLNFSS
jgi:hypothetical protein